MTEIPKTYDPAAVESKWYSFWEAQNCFLADAGSAKPPFSIVIPPPNVTGILHLGHVLNNTIQDILARKARMDGKAVLWLPGTDHAGIATQTVVERQLKKEEKISRRDLGREKFVEKVWQWKEKHGNIIIEQLKKLGCSCDWSRARFTMDADYSRTVAETFVDLYQKGLIYKGKRMVNWCPVSLTALSDEEVTMKEQNGLLYYFKVQVVEEPETFLTIATTRPETIPGDTAVAVNPKDERYARLIGKHVYRPLPAEYPAEQKRIPIIGDAAVDFEFGTGVLKVTPAHDKTDFEIGERHKLPQIDVLNPDATMNDLAGSDLRGLDRFKARKVAAEQLKELGLLIKEEPYQNNVGFSERADVPIEPRLSEQWFLKYPSVGKARACVLQPNEPDPSLDQAVEIIPIVQDQIVAGSIHELRDRAFEFARSHHILNGTFVNHSSGKSIRIRRKSLSHAFSNRGDANIKIIQILPELIRSALWLSSQPDRSGKPEIKAVHRFAGAAQAGNDLLAVAIVVKELRDGTFLYDHKAKKIASGGKSLVAHPRGKLASQPAPNATVILRDLFPDVKFPPRTRFYPDRWAKVYDYWMENIRDWCISRQLWWGHRIPVWYRGEEVKCQVESPGPDWTQDPDVLDTWFSSWLWPFATMDVATRAKFYPTSALVSGPDILFFWIARMVMAGFEYTGETPFSHVYLTGIVRDKIGRKMSKSLGNSPDPLDLISKYSADALRFGIMRSAPLGQDLLFDEQHVELGRNFCTKLWNACRYRQMQAGEVQGEIDPARLTTDDKWILLRLDQAIREVSEALRDYKFNEATSAIYRFFWNEYCDWYLEASKAVFFGTDEAQKATTLAVIDFVLSHTLRLMHPFLPFVTEELWHGLGYHQDMPADQGGMSIMFAPWPKPLESDIKLAYGLDETAERLANARYELVSQARNLRREFNVSAGKKLRFIFCPAGTVDPHDAAVLKILLNAETVELASSTASVRKGTPSVRSELGELFLPLEGVIDVEAEKARLAKEIAKVDAEIVKVQEKLNNPAFAQKVPASVLQDHQQRLVDWQGKREQIVKSVAVLGLDA